MATNRRITEVTDLYQNSVHTFEGGAKDIVKQILKEFPWIESELGPYPDFDLVLKALNSNQGIFAKTLNPLKKSQDIESEGLGLYAIKFLSDTPSIQHDSFDVRLEVFLDAARFLSGLDPSKDEIRNALLAFEGDYAAVALAACKLPETDRAALFGVVYASNLGRIRKSAGEFKKAEPGNEEAKEFAKETQRAIDADTVDDPPFQLGKHSKGTFIAHDPKSHGCLILKPGSEFGQSDSLPSQHEAAFYDMACSWGLGKYLPEARLVLIDGKEYAAIRMLPADFKNFNDLKAQDPDMPSKVLLGYGDVIFKWATLDYVMANGDRHAGNVMASGEEVRLIDHGSAFKEPFDVRKNFVPYYLRPGVKEFSKLTPEERYGKIPRLEGESLSAFRDWLMDLVPEIMGLILGKYGIDQRTPMERLKMLQGACSYMEASAVIAMAWSGI